MTTNNITATSMKQYLKRRGYNPASHGKAFTNMVGDACVTFRWEKPNLEHFTQVEETEPKTWLARIGVKDFSNQAITAGLFQQPTL